MGGENSFLAIAPELIKSGWKLIAAVPDQSDFSAALSKLRNRNDPVFYN